MALPPLEQCDDVLLDQYLNLDLSPEKEVVFLKHLEQCPRCRQQVDLLTNFAQDFRDQVDHAIQTVDFTALEKEVLTTVIHHPRSKGRGPLVTGLFKLTLTVCLTGGMLVLLLYLYMEGFFGH